MAVRPHSVEQRDVEGQSAVALQVGGVTLSPSICYESILPHLIRRQTLELAAQGREPDVLVNLTNDGWFWGSSELQLHLICGAFRAVELRKPMIIAANTGISAEIDARANPATGPRRDAILLAEVARRKIDSPYLRWGTRVLVLLALTVAAGLHGGWSQRWRLGGLLRRSRASEDRSAGKGISTGVERERRRHERSGRRTVVVAGRRRQQAPAVEASAAEQGGAGATIAATLLVFCVFALHGGWPIPDVNEALPRQDHTPEAGVDCRRFVP